MKISNHSSVPVYTIAGSSTARPLPEWLIRKRKRSLKQDPEFANRIELLQDFEFEEASTCVRISEDGDWIMSTGTYKPQIHTHYLPHLSLSFARHTDALNETFLLLSSDYSKSLHLQSDRLLEFHTAQGKYYTARLPRYGRDLLYDKRSTEALVPTVGVNADGNGEVFRLNLEVGRFMKAFEVDVGGDDYTSTGGGALQGGINTGSVNTGAIAETSHNLGAFGTSLGTVEFWDPRSRSRIGILGPPPDSSSFGEKSQITALEFHRSGLELATGSSNGLVYLYDLRSPVPLLKKDQGYGFPIKNLIYLNSTTASRSQISEPKLLSADKRIIKIWDQKDGTPWTSVEPAVDLNHVAWCPDSGMILTANEGRQQHAFFVPQLGPAPKWCAFLDNLVEEMAEDPNDPNAFGNQKNGEVYDNMKFLTVPELKTLSLDHLIGTTSLLRPYMHGYFVAQKLYEEARLISNPDIWQEQRQRSIQDKINKERETRIRGSKKVAVKVNRKLAERILEKEEKEERRRARRVLEKGGDEDMVDANTRPADDSGSKTISSNLLSDPRFARVFQDEDFEVQEDSHEFRSLNPSTKVTSLPKGLTVAQQEAIEDTRVSSSDSSSDNEAEPSRRSQRPSTNEVDNGRISTSSYAKPRHRIHQPDMTVTSSRAKKHQPGKARSFGSRAANLKDKRSSGSGTIRKGGVVGEREITFEPVAKSKGPRRDDQAAPFPREKRTKDRRSASGNVFRKM
ncbi:WD repeat protein [Pseudovirgaria hyperparasitica]|uniref:WD repeat protein n=1 Tax=Pseudovirgaria hyperparasitica TaxID=470096 RepID=A0A6A6WEY1_9PEZI|nr:WD repeat protein [Pseudovirgaria hyperparasitica]KAF2760446.1 WD repeat protein [Pseudovirgaria hyperparasitica]